MSGYAELVAADRRLAILRLLAEMDGYSLNTSLLQAALDRIGHRTTRARLREDLAWLAGRDLVEMDDLGEITVAVLRERGIEVAQGRETCPGVKRPAPGR